jgi:acetyl esterase
MSRDFDVHPEMGSLIAAKQAAAQNAAATDARAAWAAYGASMRRPYPEGMVVRDATLPSRERPRSGIPVRIYRPAGVADPAPCVLYLHGGAFIKGSLESGDVVAWGVADHAKAIVVSVDYRLAPEHPFPAGLEDCYAALSHVAARGSELGVDPRRIAVWGDSAGGNFAAALCLLTRDRGGPAIVAQALNYPCLTDELTAASYRTYAASPGLETATMESAWDHYLAGDRPTRNPYAAPLKAKDLGRLPPAHIHVAEIDPLSDDGRAYAERLGAAGGVVELRSARRMIHGFLRARFDGPDAAAEFAAPCAFLRRRLTAT